MLDLTAKSVERHLLKSRGVILVGKHTQDETSKIIYNCIFLCQGFAKLHIFPYSFRLD